MDAYLRNLEILYSESRRQLFACALGVTHCPERAEDAVHEAFCRLAAKACNAENLRAYVFRAVRNAAVDQLRKNPRPIGELDESFFDPAPSPGDEACDAESRVRVARALSTLGREERETIIEHIWGELTFREIAEVRGEPLGTVVSRYRRGIEKLRQTLED